MIWINIRFYWAKRANKITGMAIVISDETISAAVVKVQYGRANMKMTMSNAKVIILSNKNPIVPNKDKPLAFLEISGIKIECFHTCSYHFVVCLSVVLHKVNLGSRRAVVGQSSGGCQAVVKQTSGSCQTFVRMTSGSHRTGVGQLLNSCWAVIRQVSGSCHRTGVGQLSNSRRAVIRQSSLLLSLAHILKVFIALFFYSLTNSHESIIIFITGCFLCFIISSIKPNWDNLLPTTYFALLVL